MALIALKIDVDTYRGTREGARGSRMLLERLEVRATFLFSLGPDHTGRAIRRVFRRGFLGKVKRTSVLEHYGLKTLLYGVLLPGPRIGARCARHMRAIAAARLRGGRAHLGSRALAGRRRARRRAWTRRELTLARDEFAEVFGRMPLVHGAAGWQMNRFVPALERELGFRYASDTRGARRPSCRSSRRPAPVPQLPTTLPTLDELIGRAGSQRRRPGRSPAAA